MALRVWLPLNGNLNNQGLSTLSSPFTANNGTWEGGKTGNNLHLFNTATNTVTVEELKEIKTLTCSFWFKIHDKENITGFSDILDLGVEKISTAATANFRLEVNSVKTAVGLWGNGVVTNSSGIGCFGIEDDTWYHITFSTDGETVWVYQNGTLVTTHLTGSDYRNDYRFLGTVRMGDTGNMNVTLADIRIYDECLNAKQIKEISKGLVAHYKLEGIGANPNLLKGTNIGVNGWGWNVGSRYGKSMTEVEWRGVKACKFGITNGDESSTSNWRVVQFRTQSYSNVVLKPSTTYKISFDTDRKVIGSCAFRAGNAQHTLGDASSMPYTTLPDGTYHYSISITTVDSDNENWTYDDQNLYMQYWVNIDDFGIIANLKLEEGTKETKWIPHKEDKMYTNYGYDSISKKDISGNGYDLKEVDTTMIMDADTPRYSAALHRDSATKPIGVIPKIYSSGQEINELTLSGWLKTNVSLTNKNLINLGNNQFIRFGPTTTGHLWVYVRMGSTNKSLDIDSIGTLDNLWHHYVVTFKNGVITGYIDGIQKGTVDHSSTSTTITCAETNNYIGGYNVNQELVSGSISDVRIYSTALSATDVKELYQTGELIDNNKSLYAYSINEEDKNVELDWTSGYGLVQDSNSSCKVSKDTNFITIETNSSFSNINGAGIGFSGNLFTVGKVYRLSYYFRKKSGTLKNLGGHCTAFDLLGLYVDGKKIEIDKYSTPGDMSSLYNNDEELHYQEVYMTALDKTTDPKWYIQMNRQIATGVACKVEIYGIKIQQVSTANLNTSFAKTGVVSSRNFIEKEGAIINEKGIVNNCYYIEI